MNSKRWATLAGVLSLGFVSLSSLTPEGPSLRIVDYSCRGIRPVISLEGRKLPQDRTVSLYYMERDNGLNTKGRLALRTNQAGNLNENIRVNDGREGTSFKLEVVGTYPFDNLIAWMLKNGDLKRRIQFGHTITAVEGTIP